MVISGLNRFFARHGRVTLGILVVIISVSFVLYLSGDSVASLFSFRYRDDIGKIGGQSVSVRELNRQLDHVTLALCLESPLYSPRQVARDRLQPMARQRLIHLYAARQRGLDASREEIAAALREAPVFQRDGQFHLETFERYVKDQLEPVGLTREDLDQAVREGLVVDQLQRGVVDTVIASPREIREAFATSHEKFLARVLRFEPAEADESPALTEVEIAGFFAQHRDRYQVPPQCRVEVVRFDHAGFQAEAAAAVGEQDVEQYYRDHAAEFTTGEGEAAKVQPLAEAAVAIRAKLAGERARELARLAAEKFSEELFNHSEEAVERARPGTESEARLAAFRAFVAGHGRQAVETGWFGADAAEIPGVGREPALVRGVFELYADQPLSDGIGGADAAFVALLRERREERPAELDEAKERITRDFREEKVRGLVRERARTACLALGEALAAGQEFAAAATAAGVIAEEVPEFTALQPPMVKDGYLVGELAAATPAGQVSRLRDTYRGAVAVWVERRSPPGEAEFNQQKDAFTTRYRSWKAGNAWQGFATWLESQAQFAFQR